MVRLTATWIAAIGFNGAAGQPVPNASRLATAATLAYGHARSDCSPPTLRPTASMRAWTGAACIG